MKKEDIRHRIKARKALLDENEKAKAAEAVFNILERTAAFIMADNILMYHSLPDELSTRRFLEKWGGRKQFYLPRVNGLNLEILPYDKSTLRLGAFQIEEPTGNETVSTTAIDLIIVPGVAYDARGNRVGRGKGYYDRLLAESKATKIGVGYEFQVVDDIEADEHDVKMDIVITDRHYYHIRSHSKVRYR